MPIEEYAKSQPDKAQILSEKAEHLKFAAAEPRTYDDYLGRTLVETGENIKLHDGGEVSVRKARLQHVKCFAYSDVVLLEDGRCIYDIKEIDEIRPITDYRDGILWEDTEKWCKLKPCKKTVTISRAIKIGGMFGFNFYHLIFQLLPRMMHTADIDPAVPLLLDRKVAEIGSMKQLADWFNTESREIIYLDEGTAYKVDELYIITSANICIPNFLPGYSLYEPKAMYSVEAIDKITSILIQHKADIKTPEKIYVCRRNATKMRSYNEEELFASVRDLGFVDVYPEKMPMAEQIALFYNAKIIVSPEGAALSNLMFIHPECKVVILYCMPTLTSEFASLVRMRGASLMELYDVPENMENPSLQRNYYISPEELRRALDTML